MSDEKNPGTEGSGDDKPEAREVDPAALKPHKPTPRVTYTDEDELRASERRKFFKKIAFNGTALFLTANLFAFMKFFFPRALFEPKTTFSIGYPADYDYGVDTRWQASQRIWVVRNSEGLFVILAKCTHLGCTPDWKEQENMFKCPCHGSGYDSEGINFEGPAPRPMDRCHVELSPVGEIIVDKLLLYREPQFKDDGAILHV